MKRLGCCFAALVLASGAGAKVYYKTSHDKRMPDHYLARIDPAENTELLAAFPGLASMKTRDTFFFVADGGFAIANDPTRGSTDATFWVAQAAVAGGTSKVEIVDQDGTDFQKVTFGGTDAETLYGKMAAQETDYQGRDLKAYSDDVGDITLNCMHSKDGTPVVPLTQWLFFCEAFVNISQVTKLQAATQNVANATQASGATSAVINGPRVMTDAEMYHEAELRAARRLVHHSPVAPTSGYSPFNPGGAARSANAIFFAIYGGNEEALVRYAKTLSRNPEAEPDYDTGQSVKLDNMAKWARRFDSYVEEEYQTLQQNPPTVAPPPQAASVAAPGSASAPTLSGPSPGGPPPPMAIPPARAVYRKLPLPKPVPSGIPQKKKTVSDLD